MSSFAELYSSRAAHWHRGIGMARQGRERALRHRSATSDAAPDSLCGAVGLHLEDATGVADDRATGRLCCAANALSVTG